ncbi:class I SAM-dependent methyltransferase [Cohnella caldifontis]|uniref:class I SAM-dependent methyltransferase n=1 Tax=Cohnella caldifontis TaxID=3027471 RepID=UPI0023EAA43C|nr:class I SAM-dependent methyltransferase [Cohnella sp. YIM B05605]
MGSFFNRYYDRLMGPVERRICHPVRERLLPQIRGAVLEIGSGTGVNFPYYRQADRVAAIEPEPVMREVSAKRARQSRVPIEVIDAGAERLPFESDTFDAAVGTLVFCTIPDPKTALEEIRRVCKPGGTLVLFEHVKMDQPALGKLQDWLTPAWKRMCGGCHLNRNTLQHVEQAGFRIRRTERMYKNLFLIVEAENP